MSFRWLEPAIWQQTLGAHHLLPGKFTAIQADHLAYQRQFAAPIICRLRNLARNSLWKTRSA